jgi:hypothetical protein
MVTGEGMAPPAGSKQRAAGRKSRFLADAEKRRRGVGVQNPPRSPFVKGGGWMVHGHAGGRKARPYGRSHRRAPPVAPSPYPRVSVSSCHRVGIFPRPRVVLPLDYGEAPTSIPTGFSCHGVTATTGDQYCSPPVSARNLNERSGRRNSTSPFASVVLELPRYDPPDEKR